MNGGIALLRIFFNAGKCRKLDLNIPKLRLVILERRMVRIC